MPKIDVTERNLGTDRVPALHGDFVSESPAKVVDVPTLHGDSVPESPAKLVGPGLPGSLSPLGD